MESIYNFSAGPAVLPREVLLQVQEELLDYQGSGMSVMEMSHRGVIINEIRDRAEASLRQLMNISADYEVLFLQGGATTQFAMIPMNLVRNGTADYVNTGVWSTKAMAEANQYLTVREVASSADQHFSYVPTVDPEQLNPEADYLHITTNNTIHGTVFSSLPKSGEVPLVGDMSSDILSKDYPVSEFGLIYAGAQKNIGPAGLTLVIVRKDLLGPLWPGTPLMMQYAVHAKKKSMHNTPPTFAIYLAGLVFDWLLEMGGLAEMERRNREKAALLYDFLDASSAFRGSVRVEDRSLMNVVFRLPETAQEQRFLAESAAAGLKTLKGHRSVGGMRASLYNAMPLAGVKALISFMKEFERTL
ncbi:MAG: 3-phosphoserine/phosphohydroxythreonine transaminase [Bacteroidota bacterium]